MKYEVLIDDREKKNIWQFSPNEYCTGSLVKRLKSGDYTLTNMEHVFSIERKASTGELSSNITDKTFEKELDRLDQLAHSFLILEFTLDDIYKFPWSSSIPSSKWCHLRVTSNFILKRLIEIETQHKVKIIFAGDKGSDYAQRIFKEMNRLYAKK